MTNYTPEELDKIRAELNYFGGKSKKKMGEYLEAKRKGEQALRDLKPSQSNMRVNTIHSIKDILGSL